VPRAGVLLYGPPGVGKTHLVRVVAAEAAAVASVRLISVAGPELLSPVVGQTEARLRRLFDCARSPAGGVRLSLLFIDEADALLPRRSGSSGGVAASMGSSGHMDRVVTQFLTLMDGAAGKGRPGSDGGGPRVLVLAATNRPHALDAALRRPGRFDREIRLRAPGADARLHMLRAYAASCALSTAAAAALPHIAQATVGFVGADIVALCRVASTMAAARRSAVVDVADWDAALLRVHASALRDRGVTVQRCADSWADVGGMAAVIGRLRQAIELPLRHAPLYAAIGVSPPRGLLLHGPPGNSKTSLIRALAAAVHSTFIALSGADVLSAYVGEAERVLRGVFATAREAVPCIVFLDEIDALVGARGIGAGASSDGGATNGLLTTLLTEMDGVAACDGVLVVGATNRPHSLDPALLR
jgi:transitional endoplasmic reticulum ATPase